MTTDFQHATILKNELQKIFNKKADHEQLPGLVANAISHYFTNNKILQKKTQSMILTYLRVSLFCERFLYNEKTMGMVNLIANLQRKLNAWPQTTQGLPDYKPLAPNQKQVTAFARAQFDSIFKNSECEDVISTLASKSTKFLNWWQSDNTVSLLNFVKFVNQYNRYSYNHVVLYTKDSCILSLCMRVAIAEAIAKILYPTCSIKELVTKYMRVLETMKTAPSSCKKDPLFWLFNQLLLDASPQPSMHLSRTRFKNKVNASQFNQFVQHFICYDRFSDEASIDSGLRLGLQRASATSMMHELLCLSKTFYTGNVENKDALKINQARVVVDVFGRQFFEIEEQSDLYHELMVANDDNDPKHRITIIKRLLKKLPDFILNMPFRIKDSNFSSYQGETLLKYLHSRLNLSRHLVYKSGAGDNKTEEVYIPQFQESVETPIGSINTISELVPVELNQLSHIVNRQVSEAAQFNSIARDDLEKILNDYKSTSFRASSLFSCYYGQYASFSTTMIALREMLKNDKKNYTIQDFTQALSAHKAYSYRIMAIKQCSLTSAETLHSMWRHRGSGTNKVLFNIIKKLNPAIPKGTTLESAIPAIPRAIDKKPAAYKLSS